MNSLFRRMPLMAKLLIIAFIPLLFIGYLTLDLYAEKSNLPKSRAIWTEFVNLLPFPVSPMSFTRKEGTVLILC